MKQNILLVTLLFVGCKNAQTKKEFEKSDTSKKIEVMRSLSNQDTENIVSDYNFDTTLKGGYKISYIKNDTAQYLYLDKGNMHKLLSVAENDESVKLLGVKLADYTECFVLGHPLHILNNENPIPFELYNKITGDTLLTGYFIDANEDKNVLLYYTATKESVSDSMTLLDVTQHKKEKFKFPGINTNDIRLINRIHLKEITTNSFSIEFLNDIDNEKYKQQNYIR